MSTATRARWVAAAAIAGGGALAITLAVWAAGSSGTDPPTPAAHQETRSTEGQRAPMHDNQAARQQAQPKTTETVTDTGDGSRTKVTVNGESITVPANGSYHRTTDDGSTHTELTVNNSNQSSQSGNSASNHSSSNIEVHVRSDGGP